MAVRRILALLAGLALGVSAQTVDPKKLCTIEGRVYNGRTGEPVPRVTLTLMGSGQNVSPRTGRSDNDGHFLIEGVPAGSYRLVADRVGFLRQGYGSRTPGGSAAPLNLSEGQNLKNLDLRLTPQGVILGLITDEDGDPVPRANVRAWRQDSAGAGTVGPPGGMRGGAGQNVSFVSAMSNDIGEYRLAGLNPGRYLVVVERMNGAMGRGGAPRGRAAVQEEAPVPTYYPSTTDASNAVAIEVAAGQDVAGINIAIRSGTLYRIQGRVTGTIPQEVTGYALSLMPRSGFTMFTGLGAQTRADGSFEIARVPPGSYYIMAQNRRRQGPAVLAGKTMVDVTTADITGLIVPLVEPLTASGTVKIDGQQSVDLQRMSLTLMPLDTTMLGVPSGRVAADGTFKLTSVFPDRYYLNVNGLPDGAYVKSVKLANQDVTEKGIDLSNFRMAVAFDVVLSLKAATLEGTVTSGDKPGIGSTITALPDPLRPGQPYLNRMATADQDGKFTSRGLAPGAYKVYAFEDAMPGLTQDPGLAAPYERSAVRVDLDESDTEQVELKVLTAGDARR